MTAAPRLLGTLLLALLGCVDDHAATPTPAPGAESDTPPTSESGTERFDLDAVQATIEPPSPCADRDLSAVITGATPTSWRWLANGQVAAPDDPVVPAARTRTGQRWELVARIEESSVAIRAETLIEACPPSLSEVSLTPETPTVLDEITAEATATAPDSADAVELTYTWRIDGEEISSGSEPALPAGAAVRGQLVQVEVTAEARGLLAGPVISESVEILNAPPAAPGVQLSPEIPLPEQDLQCVVDEPIDPDGDLVTTVLEWTVDGEPFTDAVTTEREGDTILASQTSSGEEWACTVTSTDPFGASSAATRAVTIPSGLVLCGGMNTGHESIDTLWGAADLELALQFRPDEDVAVGRIEVFTGEQTGGSAVSIWTDLDGHPHEQRARAPFSMSAEPSWQGADLGGCYPVEARRSAWLGWEPIVGSLASAQASGETAVAVWGSEGHWEGPYIEHWKYRVYCCE